MTALFERSNRFLDRTLALTPRAFLVGAALFSGLAAFLLAGQDAPGRRTAPFLLGALALLLLRAAVHGKISSLIDVVVLAAYMAAWAAWSAAAASFEPGPVLWLLAGAALSLLGAAATGWRDARAETIGDLRTVV